MCVILTASQRYVRHRCAILVPGNEKRESEKNVELNTMRDKKKS